MKQMHICLKYMVVNYLLFVEVQVKLEDSVLKRNGLDPIETPPIQINGKYITKFNQKYLVVIHLMWLMKWPFNAEDLPFVGRAENIIQLKYQEIILMVIH